MKIFQRLLFGLLLFQFFQPTFLFAQGLVARIENETRWSLIDPSGRTVSSNTFGHINPFSEGLASFRQDGKWGFINGYGEVVIRATYHKVLPFSCGMAAVSNEKEEWSYINKKDETVVSGPFSSATLCYENVFFAKKYMETDYRLFNSNGKEISTETYKEVYPFKNGMAVVRAKGNTWKFINTKGEVLHQGQYGFLKEFSDGMALYRNSAGWGYLDSTFQVAIPAAYAHAAPFANGYARVEKQRGNASCFLIDKKGIVVYGPLANAGSFSEGLIAVKSSNGLWGFLNTDLKLAIKCEFTGAKGFKNGLALAKSDRGFWGYLNQKGEWQIIPKHTGGKDFKNGFALVKFPGGKWGYINTESHVIRGEFDHGSSFENISDANSEEETPEE